MEMMKSIGNSIVLMIMLLMSACAGTEASDDSAPAKGGNVTVTGHADGAPAVCSVEEVGQRLVDFANAFNQRDSQLVPMFFGAGVWYMASEGVHAGGAQYTTIYLGRDLPAFFERRFAQHEQILLNNIQVNGWEAQRNIVHFAFTLSRQADDLHNGAARDGVGKGAFQCETQKIIVIAME